jgi:hypothetical protein
MQETDPVVAAPRAHSRALTDRPAGDGIYTTAVFRSPDGTRRASCVGINQSGTAAVTTDHEVESELCDR